MPKSQVSDTEFLLLRLTITERNGREIAKLFEAETRRKLSYGTLYTTLRRMREEGLVRMREGVDGDGRLRFFRITGSGTRALNATRAKYEKMLEMGGEFS